MKLTFWGAARQVTGSMFHLQLHDGYSILIDCGSDLSRKKSTEPLFPFHPSEIDLVVLTHAHYDHSGNIPNLFIQGYKGQVLCTGPTQALTEIILKDSAMIQTNKLDLKERSKSPMKNKPIPENFYMVRHVDEAVNRFVTISFDRLFQIRDDLFITFFPTGHLLGAANVLLKFKDNNEWKKILFSGDIGRKDYPLLQDPTLIPEVDYLVCETTYGIRTHQDSRDPEETLAGLVENACVKIPGRLIIPSFSIGRTQSILYTLHKLFLKGKLPPIKIFADSPMAEQSSRTYERFSELLNEEAKAFLKENKSLFDFQSLVTVQSAKESREISNHSEPCIIISSSGMLTGGRVENHLRGNLSNPYCTVLMVGYSAEGTPGHQLTKQKTISIKGKNVPVMANIITTDIFSGHADQDDLLAFVKSQNKEHLRKIFLVHGEYDSMAGFKKLLETEGYTRVEMPKKGDVYEI